MTALKIKIGNKWVGGFAPCFIIAEAGINHNGDLALAKKMVDAALACGVDAVKFQTFTAADFIQDETIVYEYQSQGKKVKESMLKMFQRCEFTEAKWREIAAHCQKRGILFFSTPQDESNLELLLKIGVPAIKVGSDDMVNLPLLSAYSKKNLPMIISTGMAYLSEVEEAVATILENNRELVILHCVSSYPTPPNELNLRKMETLRKNFPQCVVGFSDHSLGTTAAIAAAALGAKVFEKHFTLDRNLPGPDHWFSSDPQELKELVAGIRASEEALGDPEIKPTVREVAMRKESHRSVVAARDIEKGEVLQRGDLILKRPGTGLPPKFLDQCIGKTAKVKIPKNGLLKPDFLK